MLKRSNRLSTKQFMEVMEKGRVTHSPLFIMRILSKENLVMDVRIAAVAPKKVAPTAVLRNGIKRHIYEAVQPMIHSIIPNTHIIIFAKTEAVKADFKAIGADIKNLFSKAKISV
jgi:ribonuclease P protein component